MEEIYIKAEQHEQRIRNLEESVKEIHEVQSEIRAMNETLITLATELKHTNEHLERHERKIEEIDGVPKTRMQQIITAVIAALAGGIVSVFLSSVFRG